MKPQELRRFVGVRKVSYDALWHGILPNKPGPEYWDRVRYTRITAEEAMEVIRMLAESDPHTEADKMLKPSVSAKDLTELGRVIETRVDEAQQAAARATIKEVRMVSPEANVRQDLRYHVGLRQGQIADLAQHQLKVRTHEEEEPVRLEPA